MTPATPLKFYFGGELFSSKHLLGNAMLAEAIHVRSQGRYLAVLPQNLEQRDTSPHAIRDQDIRALLACDLGLFNYDGPELDSGTVVEFLFAKFADIPSVLVRTDFRHGGDQEGGGDPWNLMTSFYPRTELVLLNAMELYQRGLAVVEGTLAEELAGKRSSAAGISMLAAAADGIVAAFDKVLTTPPALPAEMRETVYRWLALLPGFKAMAAAEATAELLELSRQKQEKGLL